MKIYGKGNSIKVILKTLFNVKVKTSRKSDPGNALESCGEDKSIKSILEMLSKVAEKAREGESIKEILGTFFKVFRKNDLITVILETLFVTAKASC